MKQSKKSICQSIGRKEMRAEEIVLLLTGTVSPDENVMKLSLKSPTDRLAQYRDSILWILQNTSILKNCIL